MLTSPNPILERFEGIDWTSVPDAEALAALAHLAPWRCIALAADPALTGAISRAQLVAAVEVALARGASQPETFDATAAAGALDAFGAELAAPALGSLARVAPDLPNLQRTIDRAVERGAADPALLRTAITLAQRRADAKQLESLFARLAQADPTPATLSFIARTRKAVAAPAARTVKVALVSSYTIDHLVPFLEQSCRELGLAADIYVAPFNSWTREAIDPSSGLRAFAPEITFLSVSIDDLVPGLDAPLSTEQRDREGDEALARVLETVRAYTAWAAGAPLVVHTFHSVFSEDPAGLAGGEREPSRLEWLRGLNLRLASAVRELGARTLDVEGAATAAGVALVDAPKLRHIAAMHLPPQALNAVARAYARYIAPLKGLTRKCVVIDLDNTLWGGVVGEDGKEGLRLGHVSPGSEFVEFQKYFKGLSERGLLLALCSKNNEADALDAIRTHPAMVLRESDFSAMRINWQPKPDNLLSIARELNIGVDSFVFVDDNPDERELMRAILPEVLTVELPRDPALYRATLEKLPQLQVLTVTAEDRERPALYATSRLREAARTTASSLDDYLHSLEVTVKIQPARPESFNRIAQLFMRTNQFNTTTRRYDLTDVGRLAADPRHALYTLESSDRFGSHGLVAVALVEYLDGAARIDTFLMSCRVIGYGIETAMLSRVASDARARGAQVLRGEFIPTKKNAPATNLFAQHGFEERPPNGDVLICEVALAGDTLPMPPWITDLKA